MRCICLLLALSTLRLSAGNVPQFRIDLNKAPSERWIEAATHYKRFLPTMMREYQRLLDHHMPHDMQQDWLANGTSNLDFSEEITDELQGIVDLLGDDDVTIGRLKLWQMMYEVNQGFGGSGVLVAKEDGTVTHGRNMDYGFRFRVDGQEYNWPDITFEALWLRDGKEIATSVQWIGHTTIHTGMRFGGWTVEQNTRGDDNSIRNNLAAAKQGSRSFGYAVRELFLRKSETSFETAVAGLAEVNLNAPMYFIMSGPGDSEGAVISKDCCGQRRVGTPDVQRIGDTPSKWHILQTNSDVDETRDDRRIAVAEEFQGIDRSSAGPALVEAIMTARPLYNGGTVFVWMATPRTGEYHIMLPSDSHNRFGDAFSFDPASEHKEDVRPANLRGATARKIGVHERSA